MDKQNPYFRQVELLVRVLPVVSKSSCFALKGGTAINMFYRDMPRLSVDIDLVYVPIKDRKISLEEMTSELQKIGSGIGKLLRQARIQYSRLHQSYLITRILIEVDRAVIKIEVSPVLRGTVWAPLLTTLFPIFCVVKISRGPQLLLLQEFAGVTKFFLLDSGKNTTFIEVLCI